MVALATEEDGGWNTSDIRGGHDIGLWKDMRKEWLTLSQNTTFLLRKWKETGFLEGLLVR